MKIISGKWGGQSLPRKVNPKMRPTSDKLREAIFDLLEARVVENWENVRVLDLFAGTGAFGFEALSRGAKFATFVDNHLHSTKLIERSLSDFEMKDYGQVICKGSLDAISWLHRQGRQFEIVFMDPPYRQDWVVATLNRLHIASVLSSKAVIVAEHDKRESLTSLQGTWHQLDSRRYGDSSLSIFCTKRAASYWQSSFKSKSKKKSAS